MISPQIYVGLPEKFRKPISLGIKFNDENLIINAVSLILEVPIEDIKSKSRKRHIVEARCIAIYLIYNSQEISLKKVGKLFSGLDHSTILYSNKNYNNLYGVDKKFTKKVDMVKEYVGLK